MSSDFYHLVIMEKWLSCEKLGDVLNTVFCGVICVFPGLLSTKEVAPPVTTEPLAVFLKSCDYRKSEVILIINSMLTVKSGSGSGILAAMTSVPLKVKPCEGLLARLSAK